MMVKGFSDNTVKAFQADLRILAGFLSSRQRIGHIATRDLHDFLAYLLRDRGRPCNPKSYARRITTLKVFFGWLSEVGAIPVDPAAPLVHGSVHTPLPRVLSDEQVEQLYAAARDVAAGKDADSRPLLLTQLVLTTGIKKSECMGIHLAHLDLSNPSEPQLHIRYREARMQHKERTLRLRPDIVPIVRAYREKYQPAEHLFECTARNLEYVLGDLAERAGIDGGVSFESLRWTAALRDYQAGMDTDALRRKLGLSKLRWREALDKIEHLAQPPA
jgi:site-specific recombinase XerD